MIRLASKMAMRESFKDSREFDLRGLLITCLIQSRLACFQQEICNMKMRLPFMLFVVLALLIASPLQAQQLTFKTSADLSVGAEMWEDYGSSLQGKSVAVVANHTSFVGDLHLVDYLLEKQVKVVRVFAPEHGFRGKADAGEKVESGKDAKTGLPIISLYGSHKKPTEEDLSGIDVVIFDIQDVGARFYTYISTMTYVMEACAEQGKQVLILDRPNPNGFYVDGPVLEEAHESFVGVLPIPVVHAMTVAELAQMINGEGWLEGGSKCDLQVVKCKGYTHRDVYVLPIKPSPNLPTANSILLYPSLCFFEGTSFSVGRGTDHPFEVFGHPNATIGSFVFVPAPNEGSKHPPHNGVPCVGWDLTQVGGKRVKEKQTLILDWILDAYESFPNKESFFLKNGFFEKLAGTKTLRAQIIAQKSADEIRASWQEGLTSFKAKRKKYLLYPDFE